MAQVPYSDGVPSVMPDTKVPDDYQHLKPDAHSFGASVAEGAQALGAGALKAAKFYGQVATDDTWNQAEERISKIVYGDPTKKVAGPNGQMVPDTGFMGLRGDQALRAWPEVQKQIDSTIETGKGNLGSAEQQLQYDSISRRYRSYLHGTIGRHADTQAFVYYGTVNDATAKNALRHIANNAESPDEVNAGMADLVGARVKTAQLKGGGPEMMEEAAAQAKQEGLAARVEAIGVRDPKRALEILDKNKNVAGVQYDNLAARFRSRADHQAGTEIADDVVGLPKPGEPEEARIKTLTRSWESSGVPTKVNQLGYAGLYQFGAPRLETLGVYKPGAGENVRDASASGGWSGTKWSGQFSIPGFPEVKTLQQFLGNPAAQNAAFDLHKKQMDKEIQGAGLESYIGKSVAGIPVTRDGLYAMIHLGGIGSATRALKSDGTDLARDANGTSVLEYLRRAANPRGPQVDKLAAYERVIATTADNPGAQAAAVSRLNQIYTQYHTETVQATAAFDQRRRDTLAQAHETGVPGNPLDERQFVDQYGIDRGRAAYREYMGTLQTAADSKAVQSMTAEEQQLVVDKMVPAPGTEGYAAAIGRRDALKKFIDDNQKLRRNDPAEAVAAEPAVKAATQGLLRNDPKSWQAAAAARMAAQERLGIPENARAPITLTEAQELTVPLRRMLPGQEREVLTKLAKDFKDKFGPYADEAFEYAIRANKLTAETTQTSARLMKKLGLGQPVTQPEAREVDDDTELTAAADAINATAPPPKPADAAAPDLASAQSPNPRRPAPDLASGEPLPTKPATAPDARDIMALRANPKLSARFDQKYGTGKAKKILEDYPVGVPAQPEAGK